MLGLDIPAHERLATAIDDEVDAAMRAKTVFCTWLTPSKDHSMEIKFLQQAVQPGEKTANTMDDGTVIGWLIGDTDGTKHWVGQMTAADLALAGVPEQQHEEPIIWIVEIRDAMPTVKGFCGSYEQASAFVAVLINSIKAKMS